MGTAAYLDVFGSIHRVMEEMRAQGYDVSNLPATPKALMEAVLKDPEAMEGAPELAIAHRMSVAEYERLTPYSERLEENWGKPPGNLNSDGTNLLIYGRHFGNVFVGVQPTFGYEGDPMRLLYSRSASPHHGFAAYYTYLEKVWGADAVLHFGTHGSLEFMPGKQMGMSETCYPDSLIGALPNLYYYAANNPSEATIAKRRGYASTISYLTPPAENAGLYKGLKELGELVGSYQQLRESSRGIQIVNAVVETARQCNLDKDVVLPEVDASELDLDARDSVIGAVYRQLMEIESRLLPCGLHTIGKPPTAEEAIARRRKVMGDKLYVFYDPPLHIVKGEGVWTVMDQLVDEGLAVAAAGVNFVDGLIVQGLYQLKPTLPFVPGGEIAGTISAIGPDVQGWNVGDRVLSLCGLGGCAERLALSPLGLIRIPDSLDFARAASLVQAYATNLFAYRRAHLQEEVLQVLPEEAERHHRALDPVSLEREVAIIRRPRRQSRIDDRRRAYGRGRVGDGDAGHDLGKRRPAQGLRVGGPRHEVFGDIERPVDARVEAGVVARGPRAALPVAQARDVHRGAGHGERPAGGIAQIRDGATRKVKRPTIRTDHDLDHIGVFVFRRITQRGGGGGHLGVSERGSHGVDHRRVHQRLIALHVEDGVAVASGGDFGDPVRAAGMIGAGHFHAAKIFRYVGDAFVVRGDNNFKK